MERDVTPRADLSSRTFAIALSLLLAIGLLIRLWGIKHGLPYLYNLDEGAHFVPKAVAFFSGDFNPHYFINPPAFTYLLYAVFLFYFGGADAVQSAYAVDQETVFIVARATSAVLGTVAIGLVAAVGVRLFDRRVGIVAAALMAFAFLPVYYSHLALNDVPTLVPILVSLYGSAGILTRDRRSDWVLAGLGLGLAAATKYTAAIVLVPLLAAAAYQFMHGRRWNALILLGITGVISLVVFIVVNPYSVLSGAEFRQALLKQQTAAGDLGKLGQTESSGIRYYLWSLTWGIGWIPAIAAGFGAVLLFIRDRWRGIFLVVFPLAFILYMGTQGRFFGRWLIPILPAVILLASYAAVSAIDRISFPARIRWAGGTVFVAITVALVLQAVVHSVNVDRALSRADTRNLARDWLVKNVPAGSKVVIEPIVPHPYIHDPGKPQPVTPSGNRWIKYPTGKSRVDNKGRKLPGTKTRVVYVEDFERVLRPALLKDYRGKRYCWVMVGSTQYGRAFADPDEVPKAIEYYRLLEHQGKVVYRVSPYKNDDGPDRPGKTKVPFSFDFSFNYYPLSYERPGPDIIIYRIPGNECGGRKP